MVGGSNGHSDDLSCGEMYEPEIDDWTPVPELRTNRCNAGNTPAREWPSGFACLSLACSLLFPVCTGVCALNGKLYIVGGSDPYGQKGLKNCDVFDPVTKSWTSCAPLNIRKFAVWCGRAGGMGQLQNCRFKTKPNPCLNVSCRCLLVVRDPCAGLQLLAFDCREASVSSVWAGRVSVHHRRSGVVELPEQRGALQSGEQHLDADGTHERGSARGWSGCPWR